MPVPRERDSGASDDGMGEDSGQELALSRKSADDHVVIDIALDELEDSPFQVKQYDDLRVKDLAETILKQGLLQPATVRQVSNHYQLISGHARRAALRYLRDRVATSKSASTTGPSAASWRIASTTPEPRRSAR